MASLTIAGTAYEVLQNGATEGPPRRSGKVEEMFSGRLRSTVRAENRVWDFALAPLTTAAYEALRGDVGMGAEVTVDGDLVGNVARTCIVDIQGADYIPTEFGLSHEFLVTVQVREV